MTSSNQSLETELVNTKKELVDLKKAYDDEIKKFQALNYVLIEQNYKLEKENKIKDQKLNKIKEQINRLKNNEILNLRIFYHYVDDCVDREFISGFDFLKTIESINKLPYNTERLGVDSILSNLKGNKCCYSFYCRKGFESECKCDNIDQKAIIKEDDTLKERNEKVKAELAKRKENYEFYSKIYSYENIKKVSGCFFREVIESLEKML